MARRCGCTGRHGVYHRREGSGWVPVGLPAFKTGDAALGVAWWVRLPRAPATRREKEPGLVADPSPRPPSVEHLLAGVRPRRPAGHDHEALADAARAVLDEERRRLAAGEPVRPLEALADDLSDRLRRWATSPVTMAINATGVIVHTNLGRAPWPAE